MISTFKLSIFLLVTFSILWNGNVNGVTGNPPLGSAENTPEPQNAEEQQPDENVQRFKIIVSPRDTRSYRGLKLANNLQVLLIEDPATTIAAASLTVGAGSLNRIEELAGVTDFLGKEAGSKSVCPPPKTTEDTLTYSFEMEHTGIFFYVALDKFANLFVDPKLNDGSKEAGSSFMREPMCNMKGVTWTLSLVGDSQGKYIAIVQDMRKIDARFTTFYSKQDLLVLTGKDMSYIESSPSSPTDKLAWYSANIMTLVVLAKDPLDRMEEEVRSLFEGIEDKHTEKRGYTNEDPVWDSSMMLAHKIYIVPQTHKQLLRFDFIHPDLHREYRTAPWRYVSYLLEHQGQGSLISKLRERKLCTNLKTDYNFAAGVGLFSITCSLTDEGLKAVDEIMKLVFQYIQLMEEDGINEWICNELRDIDDLAFTYKEDYEPPLPYVETLAVALQHYPMEDVLSFKFKHGDCDLAIIKRFFSLLRSNKMNVSIMSKSLEKTIGDSTDTWCGMKYKIDEKNLELIEDWTKEDILNVFVIPSPNDFIPEYLEMYKVKDKESSKPYPLQESYISQIWFKQTNEFRTPRLHVHLHFWSPMSRMDPSYRCLLEIFLKILNSSLREQLHYAQVAGINWSVKTSTYGGILVDVYGYEDKLHLVLEEIISRFTKYESKLNLNEELFLETKQEFQDDLSKRGTKTRPPTEHGWDYLVFLLSEAGWTDEDLLIVLEPVTFEDLQDFLPDLMTHIYIQGLIHGNSPKGKAMDLVTMLEKPFESIYGLLPQQLLPGRIVKLTDRSHFVYIAPNTHPKMYAYYAYFQLILKTMRDHVVAHLLVQALDVWCRDILGDEPKPREQSACGTFTMSGVQGIFIMAASDEKDPLTIDKRVDEFVKEIPKILNGMSDEQFKKVKADLMAKKIEKPRYMKKVSERYFFEIENRTYYFDRHSDEAKEAATMQMSDLLTLYKENLNPTAATRSKLAVYIVPEGSNVKVPSGATKIENITMFKSSLRLLPLPRPQIPVSAPGNKSKLRDMTGEL